ncbi:MAG TPA: hypothetical protein DCX06_04200 [Opitutae bacterium]|nr:hypothetical protein [Opitutae bacterium]
MQHIALTTIIIAVVSPAIAYEQGSYLILDVVDRKTEALTAAQGIQIEKKQFLINEDESKEVAENTDLDSDFLLSIPSAKTSTTSFGSVDLTPQVDDSTSSTSNPASPTFGSTFEPTFDSAFDSDNTSVFGQ